MKKLLEKIKVIFGSALMILTLQQPVNADEIYSDTIKWLANVMNERTLDSILNDPQFSNLEPKDLENEIAELLSKEQTENITNNIEALRRRQSERTLTTTHDNRDTSATIIRFKNEFGGYGRLSLSNMYSLEHTPAYPKYFDKTDERWNNCDANFAPVKNLFGEPRAIRDLSFDPPRKNSLGWYTDELEAEWSASDFIVQYKCYKLFLPQQFSEDGASISELDRNTAKSVQTALNFYGFEVGNPDGIFGSKSRDALSEMQSCIGQNFSFGGLFDNEIEFLVQSYQKTQAKKSVGNCKDLQDLLPQELLLGFSTVTALPNAHVENLKPITWLNCKSKTKTQNWVFNNTSDKEDLDEVNIYGIDFREKELLAKNGNAIASDIDISETEIIAEWQRANNKSQFFDDVHTVVEIDRITGSFSWKSDFLLDGKLQAEVTERGGCELLKVENRKF